LQKPQAACPVRSQRDPSVISQIQNERVPISAWSPYRPANAWDRRNPGGEILRQKLLHLSRACVALGLIST